MSCAPEHGTQGGDAAARHLAALVESSDDAIYSERLDGSIASWNRGARTLLGYAAAQVIGRPAALLVPAELQDESTMLVKRARSGDAVRNHPTVRVSRTGAAVDVIVTLSPVRDRSGDVIGVSTIARDTSEQRSLATALDTSKGQLQQALAEARRSEERMRGFLADAAHQLRQPITGVRACAESLLAEPGQQDRQRLLASLVREAARAGRLIASLLRLARLDQGEAVHPQPCDLVGVCTDEADRLYSLAPHLDVVLRADPVDDPRPAVDADAIREIVANLLDNARRYAVSRIMLGVTVVAGTVEIHVADDGPGLAPDAAEHAFERFVSLDSHGGSGLGLAIARSLARAHGGDLTYTASTFVLRLPGPGPAASPPAR